MKKIITGFFLLCLVLLFSACSNEENKIIDSENEIVDDEKKNISILKIATLGELTLESNVENKIEIVQFDWDIEPSNINETIRFIIISNEEEITDKKQAIIQGLIKQKKIVFIFGRNQTPKEVQRKIGIDFEPISIESEPPVDHPLYGYGYSIKYKKNMPFFFGSNIKSDSALLNRTYESLRKYQEKY